MTAELSSSYTRPTIQYTTKCNLPLAGKAKNLKREECWIAG